MRQLCKRLAIGLLTLASVAAVPMVFAEEAPAFAGAALSDEKLGDLRGGFLGEGFRIALDIQRLVSINGEAVSSFSLTIPDLGAIAARGAAGVEIQGSPVTLIQNGPGNSVNPGMLGGAGMLTLIQNSLDRQLIHGNTIINATVSGTGGFGLSETLSAVNLQTRAAAR